MYVELIINSNSLNSRIIKKLINFSGFKKNTESIDNAKKYIDKCNKKKLNKKMFRGMYERNIEGSIYYLWANNLDNNKQYKKNVLLYIHGGSFVEKPLNIQINFMKKLSKKLNFDLVIPIYNTIPKGNCIEMLSQMEKLYNNLSSEYSNIYLIGDSAGGGSVLSLNMKLVESKLVKPSATILLSPWLDLTLSNPDIEKKSNEDIVCSINGNRYCGKLWANNLDIKDYKVSPIYGNIKVLDNIFISCGGCEICQPDCLKLVSLLRKERIYFKYVEYKNQFHNFELYPIKESELLLNDIINFIKEV